MAARTSPAVRFPLRGAGALRLLACLLLTGAAILLVAWWYWGAGSGQAWWLRWLVGMGVWVACAVLSVHAIQRMPCGHLQWTGTQWSYEISALHGQLAGSPQVLCDCGWCLALRWHTGQGQVMYFWLQRDWAPAAWSHLRRAVYLPLDPVRDSHGPGALP